MPLLLDALAQRYPQSSKRSLRQMIAQGRVTVDGVVVERANVEIPDEARVALGRRVVASSVPDGLDVVLEDDDLLVIDKPAGMLSVAPREAGQTSVWALVRKYLAPRGIEPMLVHRLDEAVSGLLVFAKSQPVHAALVRRFARHDLERAYVAIVDGQPAGDTGSATSDLITSDRPPFRVRSLKRAPGRELRPGAERAVTHWQVLARDGERSALLVRLETGKKHQIRVHLAEAGHPIVGDRLYGGSGFARLLLHASFLGFQHPRTGVQTLAVSQPPALFRRVCARLPSPVRLASDATPSP